MSGGLTVRGIVGIDEVGRGCWAGPMVVGAVVLKQPIVGLRDSKKLSKIRRVQLDAIIREQAAGFGLGWVTPAEIDEHGLSWAEAEGMKRALSRISCDYSQIIIDGNLNYFEKIDNINDIIPSFAKVKISTMIGADDIVPAVSAASIIAKVARDNYMAEQGLLYPNYGFENHVGYGTKIHLEALKNFGALEIHRKSFAPIKKLLEITG